MSLANAEDYRLGWQGTVLGDVAGQGRIWGSPAHMAVLSVVLTGTQPLGVIRWVWEAYPSV